MRNDIGEQRRNSRWRRWQRWLVFRLVTYLVACAVLVAINLLLGGRMWSPWIAGLWGCWLLLRLIVGSVVWRFMSRRSGGRGQRLGQI